VLGDLCRGLHETELVGTGTGLGEREVDLQGAGEEYSCGVEEELWPHRVVVAIHDDDVLVPGIAVVDLLTAEWRGGGRAGRMGRKVKE
jgi:hypothetical protein